MWKDWLSDSWSVFRRQRRAEERKTLADLLIELQAPDSDVRRQAASGLRRFEMSESVAALLRALEDPVAPVRATAALALGGMRAPGALEPLLHLLLHDESGYVRAISGTALGWLDHDPRAAAAFAAALKDEEWKVVTAACAQVEEWGLPEAVPALLPLLDHPRNFVRESACSALVALGVRDPKIVATLEALVADPERSERERFGIAVGRLLETELGEAPPPAARELEHLLARARLPPRTGS